MIRSTTPIGATILTFCDIEILFLSEKNFGKVNRYWRENILKYIIKECLVFKEFVRQGGF